MCGYETCVCMNSYKKNFKKQINFSREKNILVSSPDYRRSGIHEIVNLHSRWLDKIPPRFARPESRGRRNFIMRPVIHNFHGNVIFSAFAIAFLIYANSSFSFFPSFIFRLVLKSQQWEKLGIERNRFQGLSDVQSKCNSSLFGSSSSTETTFFH